MDLLKGKSALVIGAGSGIGRAVARAFDREGARVAVMDINRDKCVALRTELPDCVVSPGDATSMEQTVAAVNLATETFGALDVLVNCVGLFDFYTGLRQIDDERLDAAFDEAFAVNVKSHLISVKAALPALSHARGAVILTGSTSGFYPGRGGIMYVASKFAVRGVVTALAHELAPEIRVNAVAPGGTLDTDLRGLRALEMNERVLGAAPDRAAELRNRTPLEVALTPEDHAGSYVFLASDMARGMTGTCLHPDGGIGIKA